MKNLIFVFLIVVIGLQSCTEEEPEITKSVKLIVRDKSNDFVANANLSLYRTYEDWVNEANSRSDLTTNENGEVEILDLEIGEYFVDIQTSQLTNWLTNISMGYDGQEEFTFIVEENIWSNLASVEGKTFKITETEYLDGTAEVTFPDCILELERTFFKNGKYEVLLGPSCTLSGTQSNSFEFKDEYQKIYLSFENGDTVTYKFVEHSQTQFVLEEDLKPLGRFNVTYSLLQ